MNIIFHRYNSICEPDYMDAFRQLGVEVIEENSEMEKRPVSLEERTRILGELVLETHPLFVFSINFFPYISIICEKLGVKYVAVSVDCPVVEIYSTAIRNACNRLFLFDYHQYESVVSENPSGVFYLPLGANVERLDRTLGELPAAGHLPYHYDISLVGSLYKEKDPYLDIKLKPYDRGFFDALISAQMMLPGQSLAEEVVGPVQIQALKGADPEFYPSDMSVFDTDAFVAVNHYISPHLSYLDRVSLLNLLAEMLPEYGVHLFTRSDTSDLQGVHTHGGVTTMKEMPEVFRYSKINLNPTIRSIQTGLPQRVWDVLGCGGFLLMNAQADLPRHLQAGKHLETYASPEELLDKARYYLTHEEEREEIARQGYREAKARHTVLMRVMEIVRKISEG